MTIFNLYNLDELLKILNNVKYYCDNKNIDCSYVNIELKEKQIQIDIPTIENGILIYNNKKENLQEKINMNLEINPFDKKAVELLKEFREEIDRIIKCACC